jgi:hypothetical protein
VSCAMNVINNWKHGSWRRGAGPKTELVVTEDERATLERRARRPSSSQALAQRCRIVLGCAAGKPNKQVAAEVGV